MKKHTLSLVAGSSLVLATTLFLVPHLRREAPAQAAAESAKARVRPASPASPKNPTPADEPAPRKPGTRPEVSEEEEAAAARWNTRLNELAGEHTDPAEAQLALAREIAASYDEWVDAELEDIVSRPAAGRYDDLADLKREVTEGIALIADRVGLDNDAWNEATGAPLDRLDAEIQYAETAPDPDSRLAMLNLDREHQDRMREALSLSDADAKTKAMAEVAQWYDRGLGEIFATEAPEFPDEPVTGAVQ